MMDFEIADRQPAAEALREAEPPAIRDYERLLERLASLAQALGSARQLLTIYRALSAFAAASAPCTGIFISLYDAERELRTAVYAVTEGDEISVASLPPMRMSESPQSRAVLTGEVIITDDFQAVMTGQPVFNIGLEKDPRLPQSSLVVPMAVMGRVIGAVEIQSSEPAAYHTSHATALRMAANLAANAIENVRLIEQERAIAAQLRQAQKMEAVGRLAGGVAHDFNNLLTAITGYSELSLRKLKESDPLHANISEIKKASDRAADLTRQLLAFSRKQLLQPKIFDLNTTVAEMNKMLPRLIGEDIALVTMLGPALGRVRADPGQMEQVIVNLAVNARDAMPAGGRLTIETSNIEIQDEYTRTHPGIVPGSYVMITVSDTGVGMDEQTQAQIFEPFFTTKEVGRGTGLGLAMVYGIVKQSGGSIYVESKVGEGTSFKIYLPRTNEEPERAERPAAAKELPRGRETILLVEDNELVRGVAVRTLEMSGYTVLTAADGQEALRLCAGYEAHIDLLVSDVVMPQMSGRALAQRLAELRPGLKVLFMSGYTEDAIVQRGVFQAGMNFLGKPFTPDALAKQVREVLDGPSIR